MSVTDLPSGGAFAHADFRRYFSSRFLLVCAQQMLAVAVGQHVYELTRDPLKLGLVGLALFLPKIVLTLFAGEAADRHPKRTVIVLCRFAACAGLASLGVVLILNSTALWPVYLILVLMGSAFAFDGPANQAILPLLVPPNVFHNAVTWHSASIHVAVVVGPALSGIIYAVFHGPQPVIAVAAGFALAAALLAVALRNREAGAPAGRRALTAGLKYVFSQRLLLGAISLDLFAVLLGGAVALLPVFANDVLGAGALGLGVLRAAPAAGAALMAVALSRFELPRRAGPALLVCVALFGAGTIAFGLSRNFALSLFCLVFIGAADMVSVVIRGVLVQIKTPQEMRGRVSAVNMIFIGASNELGEFESGLTAAWFGTVPAVVLGGIGSILVAGLWALKFPALRRLGRLEEPGSA